MSDEALCALCGHPMPAGEEMFNYHGYSGPCPAPSLMANARCPHGQLKRVCRECELEAEIEVLRAKLADCQSVARERGHAEDCSASSSACAICGLLELLHPCITYFGDGQNHEFHTQPCTCGHDRIVGSAGA